MNERFEFTDKLKKTFYIMMGVGVLGLIIGFLYGGNQHSRFWTNILLNTYYFTGIGIFGIFFVSASQLGYAGWITLVKRVILSLSGVIKWMAIPALLIVGGVFLGYHNIYEHWSDAQHRSELANTKQTFLNPVFWASRVVLYFLLWILVGNKVVAYFNRNDLRDKSNYKTSKLMAAAWIVIFAVTESFVSWDMVMSIDPHWYSTLFGWYNFASYGCAAFAFCILFVVYLKSKGYLANVTENHVHDLAKFMFGFSILWTYLWFDQFMLQWYANLPEDTVYWVKRFDVPVFKFTIFLALALNFLTPLFIILKRGNKRNFKIVSFVAVVLIFGHWLDFFNMIMYEPNVVKTCCQAPAKEGEGHHGSLNNSNTALYAENHANTATPADAHAVVSSTEHNAAEATTTITTHEATSEHTVTASHEGAKCEKPAAGHHGEEADCNCKTFANVGLPEIMIFVGYLGLFLFAFFNQLSKNDLVPTEDPYLEESKRLVVEYA